MKRVYICMGIFALIIGISVYSLCILKKSNEELYSRIDEIIELHEGGDTDKTAEKVAQLEQFWKGYYVRISFIARSSTLDDISYSVAKLAPLLKEDSDEFVSECKSVRYWAYLVYSNQLPRLYSVL
ncbi:DUF4363 family protein [Ruminococcus sp. Marseille-P6503]|uniref:DUF4363 family protein n=1 Tax=Ruminococcus sp. Marseille-P6503 TaxID=2364796 RepID=UPI000F522608|nr:DUF4363 family protein [Ruminococcus sp. Marseille-P6503]